MRKVRTEKMIGSLASSRLRSPSMSTICARVSARACFHWFCLAFCSAPGGGGSWPSVGPIGRLS
ncbi:MAG: hypothetical protein ACHRXM_24975 [Isosphaerales bacterium]